LWNRCGDNDQIANRDLKLKFISIRKAKAQEGNGKNTHTGSKIGFPRFSKSERIESDWSRDGLRLKSDDLRRGCRLLIEAQCKGGVRADSMSSRIVTAGDRRGSLGVGFEQ